MKATRITRLVTIIPTVWLGFINCAMPAAASAETETNATHLRIKQASNDVQGVILRLPDIERLWTDQPAIYFKSAKEAAGILAGKVTQAECKQAMLTLWTNVFRKPLPLDEQQTSSCLQLKWETICVYENFEEFRSNKSRWIDIAKYIGEIRSRIITNYVNRSMSISGVGLPPQELEQLLKENQRNLITDQLQQELRSMDWILVSQLLANTPEDIGKDAEFVEIVTSAAHLTKEEVTKLKDRRN